MDAILDSFWNVINENKKMIIDMVVKTKTFSTP